MDLLVEEINEGREESEKIERLHSEQYQICENGAHKDVNNGKFIKQGK